MAFLKIAVVGAIALTGLLWTVAVMPGLADGAWFNSLAPPLQYIIFNVGIYFLVVALFGSVISLVLMQRLNLLSMLVNGLAGFLIFSFVLDMFQPPFSLSSSGAFIIQSSVANPTMAGASVDFMTAWTWSQIGIHGSALYYMTYAVTPAIAVIAAVLLFGLNRFLNLFAESI